jgi:single-strand DNA-binding protein
MNSVKLIGNVGRDVSVKEFEGGRLVSFSLATDESYVNKNKEEVKNTHWHTDCGLGATRATLRDIG